MDAPVHRSDAPRPPLRLSPYRPGRGPLGLRREVLLLISAAVVLLIALSLFTLFAYRSAITLLVEERQAEALALAARVARELAPAAAERPVLPDALRAAAPEASGVALLDGSGRPLARTGSLLGGQGLMAVYPRDEPPGDAPAPPGAPRSDAPRVVGPSAATGSAVVAFHRFGPAEDPRWLRVDLEAPVLAAQVRSLRLLSWVVLGADAALGLLVLLYLGNLLSPWEALLARAREAGAEMEADTDEVAFLVETFERALASFDPAVAEGAGRGALGDGEEAEEIEVLRRTLGASFESGVTLLDPRGRVLTLNRAARDLLAVDPAAWDALQVGPRPLGELLPDHPELTGLLMEAVLEGREVRREERRLEGEGGPRTLGLSVHPLQRDDGAVRAFLVLFADLTEIRRRAEEARLAESLRQLGELTAGIAHELRNSLATLRGYLTLLERGDGDDALDDYLGEIRREADHLQRVLEDFLSFARPGSVRLQEVALDRLIHRSLRDPVLGEAAIRFEEPAPGADLAISGDPQLLERALRNLLHNAVQAHEAVQAHNAVQAHDAAQARDAGQTHDATQGADREPVRVTVESLPEGVEVRLADRGAGVPEEVRERLFEPFVSGRADGVGLGLALARRILLLHGGQLALEDRPGGGTVTRITLPRHPEGPGAEGAGPDRLP